MSEQQEQVKEKKPKTTKVVQQNGFGAVYGMGLIGAAIYFVSTATGFWMGVLGILKAIIWPAFAVYGLLNFLGM